MSQRERINGHMSKHLARFFSNEKAASEAIQQIIDNEPLISKGEMFRQATTKKGAGKPHVSRFQANHLQKTLKTGHTK